MTLGEWEAWGALGLWTVCVTVTAHAQLRRYRERRETRRARR